MCALEEWLTGGCDPMICLQLQMKSQFIKIQFLQYFQVQNHVTLKKNKNSLYGNERVCVVNLGFRLSPWCCRVVLTHYDLKTCTARTTYCLQIGHSFILLPHFVQVTMWPHSRRTQSIIASMQILHRFSSWIISGPFSLSARQKTHRGEWKPRENSVVVHRGEISG